MLLPATQAAWQGAKDARAQLAKVAADAQVNIQVARQTRRKHAFTAVMELLNKLHQAAQLRTSLRCGAVECLWACSVPGRRALEDKLPVSMASPGRPPAGHMCQAVCLEGVCCQGLQTAAASLTVIDKDRLSVTLAAQADVRLLCSAQRWAGLPAAAYACREAQENGEYARAFWLCSECSTNLEEVAMLKVAQPLEAAVRMLFEDTVQRLEHALHAVCSDFNGDRYGKVRHLRLSCSACTAVRMPGPLWVCASVCGLRATCVL